MEALLVAAALVASFCALAGCYRANRLLAALPVDKAAVLSGKVAALMVSAGKWLTIAGGFGTLPLVGLLVFAPDAAGFQWVAATGFAGCLAFALAALLLVPASLINGAAHSVRIKHLAGAGARYVLDKGLSLARQKTFWLSLAVITIVVAFLPWIIDLLTFVGYAALLVVAGRYGLINRETQENDISGAPQGGVYNYATGNVDSGFEIGGLYDD